MSTITVLQSSRAKLCSTDFATLSYSKVSATVQFSPYWFPPQYPRAVGRGGDDQMRSEFPVS